MEARGAAGGGEVEALVEEGEAEGVALAVEEFDEDGGGVDGEGEFVGMGDVAMPFEGIEHGAAVVDEDLAAEVGFLFELFDIEAVGASVEAVVDVAGGFAGVVLAVVGEFDGESMEGAFVAAGDEAFHYLTGVEVEGFVGGDLGEVHCRELRIKNEE